MWLGYFTWTLLLQQYQPKNKNEVDLKIFATSQYPLSKYLHYNRCVSCPESWVLDRSCQAPPPLPAFPRPHTPGSSQPWPVHNQCHNSLSARPSCNNRRSNRMFLKPVWRMTQVPTKPEAVYNFTILISLACIVLAVEVWWYINVNKVNILNDDLAPT